MVRRRLAVLGSPIGHSLSPVLHRAAYAALGLDWQYDAVTVTAPELAGFIGALGPEWLGLSLTMPLKTAVLPLLEESSALVRATGAANTVRFTDGGLVGDNTDVPALVELLERVGGSTGRVVLLGAGATARSALVALATAGAGAVTVVSRSRADDLVEFGDRHGIAVVVVGWPAARDLAQSADLLVSTVPATAGQEMAADLRPSGALLDVAYDPWPTTLVERFEAAGLPVATGFDLLVAQAALQVELFSGRPAPVAEMRAAGWHVLSTRR